MISPIVKHKGLIITVRNALLAYLSKDSYVLPAASFPATGRGGSREIFGRYDLCYSGYNDKIATVIFPKSNPIQSNGIFVSNVELSTTLVVDDTTLILRKVNKRLVFGIDISKNKIITNSKALSNIAIYCVMGYVLPRYFNSENFTKTLDDIESYLESSTDESVYKGNDMVTDIDDFDDMRILIKDIATYSPEYALCFDINSTMLNKLFSMIDKVIGIGSSNPVKTLLDNITNLVYDYKDNYNKSLYRFESTGFLSKLDGVRQEILDCITEVLPKYRVCLSDEVIARTKKFKVYVNDDIFPVAYIEDVSGLSGHTGKETKLSVLKVRKDGEFSFSSKLIRYNNSNYKYERLLADYEYSNKPADIYSWISDSVLQRSYRMNCELLKIKG